MEIKIKKMSFSEAEEKGITKWPVWTKEKSVFDWFYDSTEECFIIEGKVTVKTDFETVEINKGDFVIFPKGLSCVWEVKEPIEKYYNFI